MASSSKSSAPQDAFKDIFEDAPRAKSARRSPTPTSAARRSPTPPPSAAPASPGTQTSPKPRVDTCSPTRRGRSAGLDDPATPEHGCGTEELRIFVQRMFLRQDGFWQKVHREQISMSARMDKTDKLINCQADVQ